LTSISTIHLLNIVVAGDVVDVDDIVEKLVVVGAVV
jgi:hypothetical protein